jgi:hypothetical protein
VADLIQDYLTSNNDPYAPPAPKRSNKFDPYQTYDFYCIDIIYDRAFPNEVFKKFLAVEVMTPHGVIECDFTAIAIAYP